MDLECLNPILITTLRLLTATLIYLNEYTAILNLWLVTPSIPTDISRWRIDLYYEILATTIIYAISEPLITRILLWTELPPWIALLALSPPHLSSGYLSLAAFGWVRRNARYRENLSSETEKEDGVKGGIPSVTGRITLALLPVTLSAAVLNAAFTLYGKNIAADSVVFHHEYMPMLFWSVLVLFLGCRIFDYVICRQTVRGKFSGPLREKTLVGALMAIPTMIGVRAGVRLLLGLEALLPMPLMDPLAAEAMFGITGYDFTNETPHQRYWTPTRILVQAWALVGSVGGTWLINRVFRDERRLM